MGRRAALVGAALALVPAAVCGSGCRGESPPEARIVPPQPTATADTIIQLGFQTRKAAGDDWEEPAAPVRWTVPAGDAVVTKGGFFTAPDRAGRVEVRATARDAAADAVVTVVPPPGGPSPAATPRTTPPEVPIVLVFDNTNAGAGGGGGGRLPIFGLGTPRTVTAIITVHTAAAPARPGTIALRARDGTLHGPWPCRAVPGEGTTAGVFWRCTPDVGLPRAVYTVVDSDQASLQQNARSGGVGMTWICGR